jgi:hypothetical protein
MTDERPRFREARSPRLSARDLADYMVASEQRRRTIVRAARFRPVAQIIQHRLARQAIGRHLRGELSLDEVADMARALREEETESPFRRQMLDFNAGYLERFVRVAPGLALPQAEPLPPGGVIRHVMGGCTITLELACRFERTQPRTNRLQVGGAALRYARGRPLDPAAAAFQSALMFGALRSEAAEGVAAETALCLTIDAHAGIAHPAPSDAASRYRNMLAACQSIAERWQAITPPGRVGDPDGTAAGAALIGTDALQAEG